MTPDPGALDAMTASVPSGELAAFGNLMEKTQGVLASLRTQLDAEVAAERERADRAEAELKALGNRIDAVIAVKVAAERERAEAKFAAIRQPVENFLAEYGASEIPMFKVAQDLANSVLKILATCGQCDGGLVEIGGCNCGGGGPDGIPAHEPLCGAEPCPNGCWDRLHPPLAVPVAEAEGSTP